jgi:hypothetical protein
MRQVVLRSENREQSIGNRNSPPSAKVLSMTTEMNAEVVRAPTARGHRYPAVGLRSPSPTGPSESANIIPFMGELRKPLPAMRYSSGGYNVIFFPSQAEYDLKTKIDTYSAKSLNPKSLGRMTTSNVGWSARKQRIIYSRLESHFPITSEMNFQIQVPSPHLSSGENLNTVL